MNVEGYSEAVWADDEQGKEGGETTETDFGWIDVYTGVVPDVPEEFTRRFREARDKILKNREGDARETGG